MFEMQRQKETNDEASRSFLITESDLDAFALEANTDHLNDEEMQILMELLRLARLGLKKDK